MKYPFAVRADLGFFALLDASRGSLDALRIRGECWSSFSSLRADYTCIGAEALFGRGASGSQRVKPATGHLQGNRQ